jgi:hypothetical protein
MIEYLEEQGSGATGTGAQLDASRTRRLLQAVYSTQPDEISCDECFEMADLYAEMVMAGVDAAQVLPLVEDHLARCPGCREEFEALIDALRAISEIPPD